MSFTISALATELQKPRYADTLAPLQAAWTAYSNALPGYLAARDEYVADTIPAWVQAGSPDPRPDSPTPPNRYLDTEPLQQLLNEPGAAMRPPRPYTTQELLLAVGAQGIGELAAANLIGLFAIAGTTYDLGDASVVATVGALLTGADPSHPACPHCLTVLATRAEPAPCTPVEAIGAWGDVAAHNDVLAALEVA